MACVCSVRKAPATGSACYQSVKPRHQCPDRLRRWYGLTGVPETIETIYPGAGVQARIIHPIHNPIKYIGSKSHIASMVDFKAICRAAQKRPLK